MIIIKKKDFKVNKFRYFKLLKCTFLNDINVSSNVYFFFDLQLYYLAAVLFLVRQNKRYILKYWFFPLTHKNKSTLRSSKLGPDGRCYSKSNEHCHECLRQDQDGIKTPV